MSSVHVCIETNKQKKAERMHSKVETLIYLERTLDGESGQSLVNLYIFNFFM